MRFDFFSFGRGPRAGYVWLVLLAMIVVFVTLYSGRQEMLESPAFRLAEKYLGENRAVREEFGALLAYEVTAASMTSKAGVLREAHYTFAVSGSRKDGYVQLWVVNEDGQLRVARSVLKK